MEDVALAAALAAHLQVCFSHLSVHTMTLHTHTRTRARARAHALVGGKSLALAAS